MKHRRVTSEEVGAMKPTKTSSPTSPPRDTETHPQNPPTGGTADERSRDTYSVPEKQVPSPSNTMPAGI